MIVAMSVAIFLALYAVIRAEPESIEPGRAFWLALIATCVMIILFGDRPTPITANEGWHLRNR